MKSSRFPAFLLTLIVGVFAASTAFGSATIVIQNNDAPNVGFNDPTPATPIGGNSGTTLGQQRLNAFQFAADVWGATLTSGPPITVGASWAPLTCTTNTAMLGSAGANSNYADFPNRPFAGTWYTVALANAISNSDLNGASPEIVATFNLNVGTPGCLDSSRWYYGLDGRQAGNEIDLVAVLLHEFAHGLGFQTFTKTDTGELAGGIPSIYDRFLFDNSTGKTWLQMTDAERAASAKNSGNLAWNGSVVDDNASVLSVGKDKSGRPLMYTPPTLEKGSSVSHWDTTAFPNQLMEPLIEHDLTHSVTTPQDLTFSLMQDIGWCTGCAQPPPPPPPPPTPTPTVAPNDNFANAQTISGCAGNVMGHNFAATKEPGEPNHSDPTASDPNGNPGGGSVWYQWQAPSNGVMLINTGGSNFDTLLAVYTGSSVSGLTPIVKNDDVGLIRTSQVTFNAVAGTIYKIAVDGWGNNRGTIQLNWTQSNCPPPTSNTVQFRLANLSIGEYFSALFVPVSRTDTAGAATVDYSTNDFMAARCDTVSGNASAKCDYVTAGGTLRFAPGEEVQNIPLLIINDTFVEGDERLTISLSNPTGTTLGSASTTTITINDDDTNPNAANPYLDNTFFVRQQYLDFLLRQPDGTGFNDWLNVLNGCGPDKGWLGSPPGCDRVHVSSGFFRSPEFGEKGYWVYRFFEGSLGRRPQFAEFTPEMRRLSGLTTDAEQETKRADFIARFMQLPEFTNIYTGITDAGHAAQFIAKLEEKARVTLPETVPPTQPGQPPQYGRSQLIGLMQAGTLTPAQTLRAFIEQKVVWDTYFYRAFVAMQYFGYLRRDPEAAGYDDWVRVLTFGDAPTGIQPGDYRHLIFGFAYSVEYRERFGKP